MIELELNKLVKIMSIIYNNRYWNYVVDKKLSYEYNLKTLINHITFLT